MFYVDKDGDGLGSEQAPYIGCDAPEGYVEQAGDCDDRDPQVGDNCEDSGGDSGSDSGE